MIKRAPTLITVDKNDIETEWKAVKENKTGKPELDTVMAEQLKSRDEVKQTIGQPWTIRRLITRHKLFSSLERFGQRYSIELERFFIDTLDGISI